MQFHYEAKVLKSFYVSEVILCSSMVRSAHLICMKPTYLIGLYNFKPWTEKASAYVKTSSLNNEQQTQQVKQIFPNIETVIPTRQNMFIHYKWYMEGIFGIQFGIVEIPWPKIARQTIKLCISWTNRSWILSQRTTLNECAQYKFHSNFSNFTNFNTKSNWTKMTYYNHFFPSQAHCIHKYQKIASAKKICKT